MKLAIVIEAGPNNYSAYAPDVPGCVATGGTPEEVTANMAEALALHLELEPVQIDYPSQVAYVDIPQPAHH